ncbi:MAG: SDR family oxidoreductase [Bacteroidia bacterium]
MNIIITGASNGIGYYTALVLSQNESNIILALSRDEQKLYRLKTESKKINPESNLHYLVFDLENFELEKLSEKLEQIKFKSVDVLINNAGRLINKPFEYLTEDDWKEVYSVNVFSPVRLIKTLLPLMGKKEKSHIVNIGSFGGYQGSAKFKGLSAYSSSKAALANITECLAEEFKDRNIAVNCLALGAVQTEMLKKAIPDFEAPTTPQQMAQFISDFAVNGYKYFNGKIIPVTLAGV